VKDRRRWFPVEGDHRSFEPAYEDVQLGTEQRSLAAVGVRAECEICEDFGARRLGRLTCPSEPLPKDTGYLVKAPGMLELLDQKTYGLDALQVVEQRLADAGLG
jgi:hypothetical protein